MSSVALGTKESSSPEAVAAFGPEAVVFQRLILNVAADTYGDPITLTLEVLGTETLPRRSWPAFSPRAQSPLR